MSFFKAHTFNFASAFRLAVLFTPLLITNTACASSRIGGTYTSHADRFATMLQLTQSQSGQITGVVSSVELLNDGSINADETSITGGTIDGNQLTLRLSGIFGKNVAGTVNGSSIRLRTTGSNGEVYFQDFRRGSASQFKNYADQLRAKGDAIILNAKLLDTTQKLRQAVQQTEQWLFNAELHARKISGVKDSYRKIESNMQSLVARERRTSNSVTRAEISVAVNEGGIDGTQLDLDVNQTWDLEIGNSGESINKAFAGYQQNCDIQRLQQRGANSQAIETWQSACQQVQAERSKFNPVYKQIMEQRADLRSFQTAAESRRQALVDEASRIQ